MMTRGGGGVSAAALPPIPWNYIASPVAGSHWTWETAHFVATISTEQRGFYWWLGDLVRSRDGTPVTITEGRAGDFASSERDLREAIGKAYPPRIGYRQFAGALASTFQLANGNRVDLSDFEGQRVVVDVLAAPGAAPVTILGTARVVHYDLEVDGGPGAIHKIRPIRISRIVREAGGDSRAAERASLWTGMGRIYRGVMVPGCNGTPGYLPNTVEHDRASCPVHEDHVGPGSGPR